jgi:hypothetical protein
MALDLMYDTFFCEFPLGLLSEWDEFMEDHPATQDFSGFQRHYAEIVHALRHKTGVRSDLKDRDRYQI